MRKWIFISLLFLGAGCTTQSQPMVVLPNGTFVVVEIAQSDAQRIRGLSGRAGLPLGRGMLFVHEEPAIRSYWMKDMAFSIDIIWIDGDEVVGFVEDADPEEPPLTIYMSPKPVDKVLEVSSGFVAQNDLKIGDILDIELSDE
ncbi:MAG: DUF192 domain-containing protein [Candidatus Uhrbacteria bacterium]|nr:DUF192 domain-containing protein [Candidatus Uhrbacteria bacterium]